MSFNKIIIYGHLGRDPEMRFTPQGVPVCTFSVATSERKKGQGDSEPTETTTWFRITAWRNLAETANKYLKKAARSISKAGSAPASGRTTREPNGPRSKSRPQSCT